MQKSPRKFEVKAVLNRRGQNWGGAGQMLGKEQSGHFPSPLKGEMGLGGGQSMVGGGFRESGNGADYR